MQVPIAKCQDNAATAWIAHICSQQMGMTMPATADAPLLQQVLLCLG